VPERKFLRAGCLPSGTVVEVTADCPVSCHRLVDPVRALKPALVGKVFSRASLAIAVASPMTEGELAGIILKASDIARDLFAVRLQRLQPLPATATHHTYFQSNRSVFDCENASRPSSSVVWEHVRLPAAIQVPWAQAQDFFSEVSHLQVANVQDLHCSDSFCLVVNPQRLPAVFIEYSKVRCTCGSCCFRHAAAAESWLSLLLLLLLGHWCTRWRTN
jgi:hypothetical protein